MNLTKKYNLTVMLTVTVMLSTLIGCASNAVEEASSLQDTNNTAPKMIINRFLQYNYCLVGEGSFDLNELYPLFGKIKSVYVTEFGFIPSYTRFIFDNQTNVKEITVYLSSNSIGERKCVLTYDDNDRLSEIEEFNKGDVKFRYKVLYERDGFKALLFPFSVSGMLGAKPTNTIDYESNLKKLILTDIEWNSHIVNELDSKNSIIKSILFQKSLPKRLQSINFYERDPYGPLIKHYVSDDEGNNKKLNEWCDNKDLDLHGNVQTQVCYDSYEKFGKEYKKGNGRKYEIRYEYWE